MLIVYIFEFTTSMSVKIPVSIGELWDKYTILLIKSEKIVDDMEKIAHIKTEMNHLGEFVGHECTENELFVQLKYVNSKLWDIEDKLRIKEMEKTFDDEFIELARSVYYTNDERAEIKKKINAFHKSEIFEVKHYVEYK